jgi:hypothetical protein
VDNDLRAVGWPRGAGKSNATPLRRCSWWLRKTQARTGQLRGHSLRGLAMHLSWDAHIRDLPKALSCAPVRQESPLAHLRGLRADAAHRLGESQGQCCHKSTMKLAMAACATPSAARFCDLHPSPHASALSKASSCAHLAYHLQ